MKVKKLVLYSLIIAIYTVLSLVLGVFSFGIIQIRISEGLMILCLFDKKYIYPLTLACFLTNLIGLLMGVNPLAIDIIFGTFATFLSGLFMYHTRNINLFNKPLLALILGALVNTLIISLELTLLLSNNNDLYVFISNFLYIFIGEFISLFIIGLIFMKPIKGLLEKIEEY